MPPKSVTTVPSSPKAGSKSPVGVKRATAKSPSTEPPTTMALP